MCMYMCVSVCGGAGSHPRNTITTPSAAAEDTGGEEALLCRARIYKRVHAGASQMWRRMTDVCSS